NHVQMIAFPECCLTGYWFLRHLDRAQMTALAEPVPEGPSSQALLALADQHGLLIGAGLIERTDEGKLYNTYLAALPGGVWHRHRKLHAFVNPHLECGSEFTVFDTPFQCRVGILICYDNNLVENARATALLGAEILMAPHQTGGCLSRSPHAMGRIDRALWDNRERDPRAIEAEFQGPKGRGWLMRWLPSRAHDNGMFVVFSNGVGVDDDEIRTGNAMILDPYGRILVETGQAGDDLVMADLDAGLLPDSTGRRWLQARRPELYGLLTRPLGIEQPTRKVRLGEE
nr:nitrilase-related carbon-nitrogen hydrolase [bacterium]